MIQFAIFSLLKRNEIELFLKRMIAEDEKWIKYNYKLRKRSRSKRNEAFQIVAKPGLMPRKVMLSVWWDCKGIIYYRLPVEIINSIFCCQQVIRLKQAVENKRPEMFIN
uniref:Mariner Mos1 transposase n=1 Tax=Bactrocera latifrons TaxID=174628 RepID=A0A0K8TZI7_BACLA